MQLGAVSMPPQLWDHEKKCGLQSQTNLGLVPTSGITSILVYCMVLGSLPNLSENQLSHFQNGKFYLFCGLAMIIEWRNPFFFFLRKHLMHCPTRSKCFLKRSKCKLRDPGNNGTWKMAIQRKMTNLLLSKRFQVLVFSRLFQMNETQYCPQCSLVMAMTKIPATLNTYWRLAINICLIEFL